MGTIRKNVCDLVVGDEVIGYGVLVDVERPPGANNIHVRTVRRVDMWPANATVIVRVEPPVFERTIKQRTTKAHIAESWKRDVGRLMLDDVEREYGEVVEL